MFCGSDGTMKHLSLKVKLTILYTVLMTAVVCGALGILLSLNNNEILAGVQSQLEGKVAETTNDIRYNDGALEFDSDIMELKDGIYLSIYASDGSLLYGKIPYGFDNSAPFEDGNIRKITNSDGTQFYLMDMIYYVPDYGVVDIRGITSITAAEANFTTIVRLAMILLPLLVILTAILGYFMTGRTLRPVKQMTETVEEIQKNGNLSQRIALGSGKDEIYHLAETFDQLLDKIEKGFQREQRFTSDVAHELRTPITTMMLQCEELMRNENIDIETKEEIRILQKKVAYLSQMTSQLLMLSRADQGRAQLEMEKINFSELTELTVEEIRDAATGKNISVHTQIQPDIYMTGDETLLIRLWMNLLSNAIKYGNENGNIWIELKKSGERITGEVQDDGMGIDKKDISHIWERFYRADKARTGMESSGLGLSMVKWIVKEHGGEIGVESDSGKGSRFYFSFLAETD